MTRTILDIATGARGARAKPRHLEAIEQRLFVKRWRLDPRTKDLPACAIPNGMRASATQAKLAKADGMSAGVPDWMCFEPSTTTDGWGLPLVGCALEFKRPDGTGRLSDSQKWWHSHLRDAGWRVEVVTTAEEAWGVVAEYLGFPP